MSQYRTAYLEGYCWTTMSQLEEVIGYYPMLSEAIGAALEGRHNIVRNGRGNIVWDSWRPE